MTADEITLRSPAPDEMRAFFEPIADAFSEDMSEPEFDTERRLLEPERCVSAFDGDKRVGSSAAYSFRLTVPGGEVGAAGITGVGVLPDHRRRGILRQMMTWLHDDAIRRGDAVAVLGASEAAIYQRFGYGQGTTSSTFNIDPAHARFRDPVPPDPSRRIRMVDEDEAARIFPVVYDAIRGDIPGAVDRSELKWRLYMIGDADWMRAGGGPKYRAVLEVDGEPRGFTIYRVKSDWGPTGPASTLRVLEVYGLDPTAEQVLWEWLFAMDLIGTITAWRSPVPHPLQQWLLEPRRLGLDGPGRHVAADPGRAGGAERPHVRRLRHARAGRRGFPDRVERRPMAARGEGRLRDGHAHEGRGRLRARRRGPRLDLPRRLPLRRPGHSRPSPRMPARQPQDRGRAVHAVPFPVVVDPVLTR